MPLHRTWCISTHLGVIPSPFHSFPTPHITKWCTPTHRLRSWWRWVIPIQLNKAISWFSTRWAVSTHPSMSISGFSTRGVVQHTLAHWICHFWRGRVVQHTLPHQFHNFSMLPHLVSVFDVYITILWFFAKNSWLVQKNWGLSVIPHIWLASAPLYEHCLHQTLKPK